MKYFLDTEFIESFHKPLFGKRRHFIDLISIGIVAEDGREYYAISNEFKYNDADEWVHNNVLGVSFELDILNRYSHGDQRSRDLDAMEGKGHDGACQYLIKKYGKSNKQISEEIYAFINPPVSVEGFLGWIEKHNPIADGGVSHGCAQPEFYGYYSDYDWVLFCSLYGRMIDLPKGFPMYCIDLKQSLDDYITKWRNERIAKEKKKVNFATWESYLRSVKSNPDYPKQSNEHNALSDAKWNFELYKFLKTVTV